MSVTVSERISSPNQSGRGDHIPRLVVCHTADGSYEGTKAWFQTPASQTSSNYIVGQDGRVCQVVPLAKMAWCNGTTTVRTDSRYFGLAAVPLVRELGGNANQYSVSIECEGYHARTGGALTEAQTAALAELILGICTQVKKDYGHTIPMDRSHVVGHYEVNPITKPFCPGERFPWEDLMDRLRAEGGETLYRVQVGAFQSESLARRYVDAVRGKGYEAFLVQPDRVSSLYRVQMGAFTVKSNAEAFCGMVRSDGLEAFLVAYA